MSLGHRHTSASTRSFTGCVSSLRACTGGSPRSAKRQAKEYARSQRWVRMIVQKSDGQYASTDEPMCRSCLLQLTLLHRRSIKQSGIFALRSLQSVWSHGVGEEITEKAHFAGCTSVFRRSFSQ